MLKKQTENFKGQAIIEYSFAMIIIFLMAYGLIMIFKWSITDLIGRSATHESQLTASVDQNYTGQNRGDGPLNQITPTFYYPSKMRAVVGE